MASIHELEQAVTITDVTLADLLLSDSQQQKTLSLQQLLTGHKCLEHNPILEQAWEAIPLPRNHHTGSWSLSAVQTTRLRQPW